MIVFKNKPIAPVAEPVPPAEPVRAPLPPREATPPSPARDEEGAWRVLPLEGTFEFAYLDASGRPSLRRLAASELKVGPGKLLLGGVDAGLDAYRGFRVDRIHRLRIVGSDETVDRNILDWLLDRAARQAREKSVRARAKRTAPGGRRKRPGGGPVLAAA